MSYELVPLGELGEIVTGSTPDTTKKEYWDGDIPWITPADLTNHEGIYFTGRLRKITEAGYKSCSTKMIPAGSIVYSTRAPIGHCAVTSFPLCTNQGFKSIVPNKRFDAVYGFFALKYFTPQIEALGRGATFAEVNKETFENFKIPLPPLTEQKRIASLLARADRLRQLRRTARHLADSLLQSVFLEMFGEPGVNKKKWDVEVIGEFVKPTKQINPQSLGRPDFWYVDITSIDRQDKTIAEPKLLKIEDAPSRARKHIVANDILVSTVRPNLNAVAKVPKSLDNQIASTGFCVLRPDTKKVTSEYLFAIVQSNYFIEHLVKNETGANYPAVSDGIILDTPIPLPPLPLQEEFARVAARVEALRARMAESERQAEALFQSLLAESFNGER